MPQKKMTSDIFFKLAFFSTLIMLCAVFSSNRQKTTKSLDRSISEKTIYETANIGKMRQLIQEDKLSGREAMFYKIVSE